MFLQCFIAGKGQGDDWDAEQEVTNSLSLIGGKFDDLDFQVKFYKWVDETQN